MRGSEVGREGGREGGREEIGVTGKGLSLYSTLNHAVQLGGGGGGGGGGNFASALHALTSTLASSTSLLAISSNTQLEEKEFVPLSFQKNKFEQCHLW